MFNDQLINCLRTAKSIAVLTGAGVSAESGIPTFRDALDGLWAKYDPADLATPEAFQPDSELVSRWYDERRRKVGQCKPSDGHMAANVAEITLVTTRGTASGVLLTTDGEK